MKIMRCGNEKMGWQHLGREDGLAKGPDERVRGSLSRSFFWNEQGGKEEWVVGKLQNADLGVPIPT